MSTLTFLIAFGGVLLTYSGVAHFGYHLFLRKFLDADLALEQDQVSRLWLLHAFSSALFSLLFIFLLARYADAHGDISLLTGMSYGLVIGLLVYGTQALSQLAIFQRPRQYFVWDFVVRLLASVGAGIVAALII